MSAPLTGRRRDVRAGAFVLIAAQIAALGHVAGGGAPPDLPLLATMSGLLLVGLRPMATRSRGIPVLLVAMSVTQLVFHGVLELSASLHSGPGHSDPAQMLAFHAVAAVTATALLGYGDRLLVALHGWLTRLRPRLTLAAPVVAEVTWTAIVDRAGRALRSRLEGWSVSRRGPPAGFAPSC